MAAVVLKGIRWIPSGPSGSEGDKGVYGYEAIDGDSTIGVCGGAQPSANKAQITELIRCVYLDALEILLLAGNAGTGKTNLATALVVEASEEPQAGRHGAALQLRTPSDARVASQQRFILPKGHGNVRQVAATFKSLTHQNRIHHPARDDDWS